MDQNPCTDCGMATTPCSGRRGCRHTGRHEWYHVADDVWTAAGGSSWMRLILCIRCLERRLGRQLVAADFDELPCNLPDTWDTPRLAAAKTRIA